MFITSGLVGLWTLAYQSSDCAQVPLLCARQVEISSSGASSDAIAAKIFWQDSSNNTLVKQALVDLALPSSRDVPYNVFLGVEYDVASPRRVAVVASNATFLEIAETTSLLSSQTSTDFTVSHVFSLSEDESLRYQIQSQHESLDIDLTYNYPSQDSQPHSQQHSQQVLPTEMLASLELPQVRPKFVPPPTAAAAAAAPAAGDAPTTDDAPTAFNLNVEDAWHLNDPNFQANAMAISLQGLSNRYGANLYLTYPANWTFSYTAGVRDFVESNQYATFIDLKTPNDALSKLSRFVKSYVVWDEQVRDTLVVAFTVAGIEDAIVVTSDMVPSIIQQHPELIMAANFSGRFRQNTSVEIYQWAFDKYKEDTNSSMLVWMGGVCPDKMQPGVGDFGVSRKAFFVELDTIDDSSNPEYPLASKIVSTLTDIEETGAPPIVCGWHSYCSDYEHTFTTLVSKNGGRVHGLAENPNLSFMSQLSLPPGYVFHNQKSPTLTPERRKKLTSKVLIALVQTDGLGLGAWAKGGRGTLPYVWEVTLPDLEIQPVLLQMFYEQATKNDTFVGALGGPGYTYPKAVPKELLPSRLEFAQRSMDTLDLSHFVIFDASDTHGEHTVTGNTCLDREDVVDTYFKSMNRTVGFFNGYAPSFTFKHEQTEGTNRSLISFDYYLDPERSVDEAVNDLNALAALNAVRPYYLAIHVREFSTIGKVVDIVNLLDSETFEITPADEFFEMANENPTWKDKLQ